MRNFFKRFYKVNKFPVESFKKYYKYSTKYELIADMLFPLLISLFLVYIFIHFNVDKGIFESIEKINNPVLAAISILAGFNVASITVIATSQSNILDRLRRTPSENHNGVTLFDMLMGYFAWAVAIQLIVILLGVIMLILTTFLNGVTVWPAYYFYIFWIGFVIWITIILHSIFVSIRNLKYLYVFLTSNSSNNNTP